MNGSLFLTTASPSSDFLDIQAVKMQLLKIGLISDSDDNPYPCGEEFTSLIVFMGCSPHLNFEPPPDGSDNYCHIILHQYRTPHLFTGNQTAPPRCPHCRLRIAGWKEAFTPEVTRWQCPQCNNVSDVFHLDWKQGGGAGRVLVEIRNIFPGEAVPVDRLMNTLKSLNGENWRYFYTAS